LKYLETFDKKSEGNYSLKEMRTHPPGPIVRKDFYHVGRKLLSERDENCYLVY